MELNLPQRMSTRMRSKLDAVTSGACLQYACGGDSAQICRKVICGTVTVQVQCLKCGAAICDLKRDEVYFWQSLPEWDDRVEVGWSEYLSRLMNTNAVEAESDAIRSRRSTEYGAWLKTSPAWKTLRDRVKKRAQFICEGCLGQRATEVHHLTYRLGLLPPAWELRAVCEECHSRLHNWKGLER